MTGGAPAKMTEGTNVAKSILHTIESGMAGFSKGQKRIANYILQNYDKAAFMTASKLGTKVGVSESTVVRFASELGYDGYPSMQRALQEMIRSRLTSTQRIQAAGFCHGHHAQNGQAHGAERKACHGGPGMYAGLGAQKGREDQIARAEKHGKQCQAAEQHRARPNGCALHDRRLPDDRSLALS